MSTYQHRAQCPQEGQDPKAGSIKLFSHPTHFISPIHILFDSKSRPVRMLLVLDRHARTLRILYICEISMTLSRKARAEGGKERRGTKESRSTRLTVKVIVQG